MRLERLGGGLGIEGAGAHDCGGQLRERDSLAGREERLRGDPGAIGEAGLGREEVSIRAKLGGDLLRGLEEAHRQAGGSQRGDGDGVNLTEGRVAAEGQRITEGLLGEASSKLGQTVDLGGGSGLGGVLRGGEQRIEVHRGDRGGGVRLEDEGPALSGGVEDAEGLFGGSNGGGGAADAFPIAHLKGNVDAPDGAEGVERGEVLLGRAKQGQAQHRDNHAVASFCLAVRPLAILPRTTAAVCSSPMKMRMTRMFSLHSGIFTFSKRLTVWSSSWTSSR